MGRAKELWMDEVERVGDEFAAGKIEREEAETRLRQCGFDPGEISDMLGAAVA